MKKIIFSICVFICISCNSNKSNKDKVNNQILGEWAITMIYGGYCNICAKVIFKKEGKAVVVQPSGQLIQFSYKFLSNKKINFNFGENKNYFNGQDFLYDIEVKDNTTKLTLESIKNGGKYTLNRGNVVN